MATATRRIIATIGLAVVVEEEDGRTFAVEVDGEPLGGGFTKSQAIAYATTRHSEAVAEKLIESVMALNAEDPRTAARIEAATRALGFKPTGE